MSGYLRHLAGDLDGALARYRAARDRLRAGATGSHRRTSWIVAEIGAALWMYLDFAGVADVRWQEYAPDG
jgi:hypothetical protein